MVQVVVALVDTKQMTGTLNHRRVVENMCIVYMLMQELGWCVGQFCE